MSGQSRVAADAGLTSAPDMTRAAEAAPPAKTTIPWGPAFVLLIGGFMAFLDTSIVNVAIATIMNVFGATTATIQWVSTIYMLTLGVVAPLSGWLGDKIGYKRLYLFAMATFVFGSLLCALSWDITVLIVARAVQAVGGGLIAPTMMTMIFRLVPKEKIGSGMGVFLIAMLVAPAIGPTLGGYLVEYVNWRWIFTVNVPIGAVGLILAASILPEFKSGDAGRLDLPGALTAAAGLFCLLLAVSKSSEWGWWDEKTVLLLVCSLFSLALFVVLELTAEKPLLDLRVFKYATFTMANFMIVVISISMFSALFYIPLFLQRMRGLGAMETGLLMLPASLAEAVAMPIVGRLYDRTGPRAIAIIGLLLMSFFNYLFHNINLMTATSTISLWLILRGVFLPLAYNPAQISFLADVPTELVGRATAITNIIGRVASSFGIAVLTSVVASRQVAHASRLAWTVTADNPAAVDLLAKVHGLAGAGQGGRAVALAAVQGLVSRTAFVQAVDEMFIITSVLTLVGLVPAFFLKKSAADKRSAAMDA